jgi:hypothetical protein
MKSTGVIEVVAIDENPAVGLVVVVIETNVLVMPIVSPVSPSPAETSKETNSKAKAKFDSRAGKEQSWIRIPAGPDPDGFSVNEPRVVLGNVNDLRFCGLDHNGLSLLAYLLLRRALEIPRLLRPIPHYLNSVHHVLLLVDVSATER